MDRLKLCAVAFSHLFNIQYRCCIGRKNVTREFVVSFSTYDFHHLAGLKKLSDIPLLRGNRDRIFKNIISDKITYEMISASSDFSLMSDRLNYLHRLEGFMDSNDIIFSFDNHKSKGSTINAKYLLQNSIEDSIVYFFIGENSYNDTLNGVTFFKKEDKDFTLAQARWTLLYKEKFNMQTGQNIIHMDRLKI